MSNGHDHPGTWRTVAIESMSADDFNAWLEQATADGYDYDSLKLNDKLATIYKSNKPAKKK